MHDVPCRHRLHTGAEVQMHRRHVRCRHVRDGSMQHGRTDPIKDMPQGAGAGQAPALGLPIVTVRLATTGVASIEA